MFSYVYPGYRTNVPTWVPEHLLERARAEVGIERRGSGSDERPADFSFQLHDRRQRVGIQQSARRTDTEGTAAARTFEGHRAGAMSGTSAPRTITRRKPSIRDSVPSLSALTFHLYISIRPALPATGTRAARALPRRRASPWSCRVRSVRLPRDRQAAPDMPHLLLGHRLESLGHLQVLPKHPQRIHSADGRRHGQAHRVSQRFGRRHRLCFTA